MSTRDIALGRRCIGTAWGLAVLIILGVSIAAPDPATADRTTERGESASAKTVGRLGAGVAGRTTEGGRFATRPGCVGDCHYLDIYGNPYVTPPPPAVASPIGTTYSVHHLVGADIDGDQSTECFFIYDNNDPPPGAPDDVVLFDGIPEDIRTDILGTVPTVVETSTDNGDGTHLLEIDTWSPQGTSLFPGGLTEPGGSTPLVDACFLVGGIADIIGDPLDWPGMDTVTEAFISFLRDDEVVIGPVDVSGPPYFAIPWDGHFRITVLDLAGVGINGVHLEILVTKVPIETVGACCVNGVCVGDIEEFNCQNVNGTWHFGASCGANPALPLPVCERITCGFNNGPPLDDGGAPPSQFAPNEPVASGAADDFVLPNEGHDACRIMQVRAWTTHQTDDQPTVDPAVDYSGVNVTVYIDLPTKRPGGHPVDDGTHITGVSGGIVYTQTVPIDEVVVTPEGSSCVSDLWRLDIPVELVLEEGVKYWIEVQPIMDSSLGQVRVALSENNNDNPAQQVFSSLTPNWQPIVGNTNHCPEGNPATPPPGTRRNLAFRLLGEATAIPPNDNCQDAIPVTDGVVSFSTVASSTDGADEPEECSFFGYSHIESDIWYEYVASCSGELSVSLCDSGYDTKLAVYDDCRSCPPRVGSLQVCDEDGCTATFQSEVQLPVSEGFCYVIRIGGFLGLQGEGLMDIRCTPPQPAVGACCSEGDCLGTMIEEECAALGGEWFSNQSCGTIACPIPVPENDECVDCIWLTTDIPFEGQTTGASGLDESSCVDNDTLDVWNCWTADCTGVAKFSLCGSSFDTTLAVYDACGGAELACVDDEACVPQSQLDLFVTAGETYYVRVSGFGGAFGDYRLVVESCRSACCFPQGGCAVGTPAQCASVGGWFLPGWECTDADHNGVADACELPIEEWFWKDYNGEAPGGLMPDYDQNNDYDNADGDDDLTTGMDPFYCGPTAVANSLWWFDHKFPEAGVVPPEYSNADLIEDLASRMGTNGTAEHPSPSGHTGPYAGTFPDDLALGVDDYLAERGLTDLLYQHTVMEPSYGLVVEELKRSQDVVLLLGFYHVESVDPIVNDFVVSWRRTGGHYVTVAGVDLPNGRIAISDPDADAAEEGDIDFVRGGDHDHDGDNDPGTPPTFRDPGYDHTIHGLKDLASHDVYIAGPFSPGSTDWILTLEGNPLAYGDFMASFHESDAGGAFDVDATFLTSDFLQESGYPIPEVCQTYTVVEAAVIVSPFETQLVDSVPGHEESLWRSENNILRLSFDGDISWPFAGTFTIRDMLDGGAFGPDLSAQFTIGVENDGSGDPRILRIRENGSFLTHRMWVAVGYTSATDVAPFELHFPVQVGDASNDGRVLAFDVSVINIGIPDFGADDDERRDINGDDRVLAFDVSITNASIPSLSVPKPSGH